MPKHLTLLLLAVFLAGPVLAANGLANEGRRGLRTIYSIDAILRMENEEVDLGTAALMLSRQWGTPMTQTMFRYRDRLDDWAIEISEQLGSNSNQQGYRAIPVINQYLFEQIGLQTVDSAGNPEDLMLHNVMDNRRGYCLSLSVLYLSIAERLGLPMYGVVVPGHFFVRYDDGNTQINIETTSRGANPPDEHYIEKFSPPTHMDNIYMQNLTKVQTLGCFFNNLGNSYYGIGDIEEAQYQLERAVRVNPSLAEARMNLGNIYLRKEWPRRAIDEYLLALRVLPDDPRIHSNIGIAYLDTRQYGTSISHFEKAIKAAPEFLESYKNLTYAYRRMDQPASAIPWLQKALGIAPQEPVFHKQMGDVNMDMEKYQQASVHYRRALSMEPDLQDAGTSLAYCLLYQGDLNGAYEAFNSALQGNAADESAWFGLALTCNQLQFVDEEMDAYRELLALNPSMVGAMQNLANAYILRDLYDEAADLYLRAIALEPQNSHLLFNLAVAYSHLQDYEQAAYYYEQSIHLEPDHAAAHSALAMCYLLLDEMEPALRHAEIAEELGLELPPALAEMMEP